MLRSLASSIAAKPDEAECVRGVRALLAPTSPQRSQLRSVYETDPVWDARPLTAAELSEIAALELPGTLQIRPDVGPVPGIPPTTILLDGQPLDAGAQGQLSADLGPGLHTVALRHGGRTASFCVQLRACETLELVAHGAHLAPHHDVAVGRCPMMAR